MSNRIGLAFHVSMSALSASGLKPGQQVEVFCERNPANRLTGTYSGFATDNNQPSSAQLFLKFENNGDWETKSDWITKTYPVFVRSAESIGAGLIRDSDMLSQ